MSSDGIRSVKQERSIERRDTILRASVHLFTSQRVSAITHRSVAADAGVPLGAIRYYFSTREELLIASIRLIEARRHTDAQHALTSATPETTTRECARLLLHSYIGLPPGKSSFNDGYLSASVGWLADIPRESEVLSTQLAKHWPAIRSDLTAILVNCDRTVPPHLITNVIDGATLASFVWERGELVDRVIEAVAEQLEFAQPQRPVSLQTSFS